MTRPTTLRPDLRQALASQRLGWDRPNLKITNLPEANKFIRKEYRAGWSL